MRRHERLCPARFAGERAFGHLMRCYVLQSLVQPNKEVSGCLPRAQDRWSCYAGSPALMASGGARRCARGPGVVELLRSPKLHGWMSDSAVKVVQGSGGLRGRRRREIAVAEVLTGGSPPGRNPALCGRSSGRIGLGDSPAALRIFCATRGGQWCGGEVRTRRCGALLRRSYGEAVARVAAAGWEEEERLGLLF